MVTRRNGGPDIKLDVEAKDTGAIDWELWIASHIIERIPGGGRTKRLAMEIKVELLLGAKVRDADGEKVGRIEEIQVERTRQCAPRRSVPHRRVRGHRQLSAWTLVRPIKGLLKSRHIYSLYDVPWQDMDLTDPNVRPAQQQNATYIHAR